MDAVCFDMDGVIVNSEEFWLAYEEDTIFPRSLAGEYPHTDEVTGMNYREIYDYLADNYDVTVSRGEFEGIYEDAASDLYGERVALMDGFLDVLDTLRARDVALAIVSSSPQDWIGIVRDRFGLDPLDAVVSAEDLDAPGKPEPHIYEYAADRLGVAPGDCVAVEDSVNGTESASRAGMTVVGYRDGPNADADLPAADYLADGPAELRQFFDDKGDER
jgi:HAD superfamily hydrolase (TIGR01509 family)